MIGVFDSGSGGLTILKALKDRFPDQDFLYLGDHASAPYGHRSNARIVDLTRSGVERLMAEGCSLVILACNTAAAVALRTLQQQWLPTHAPDNRILGVLVPMVEAITGVPWHQDDPGHEGEPERILLLATTKTIQSRAYRDEVKKRAPHVALIEKACPGLVDAIEGGAGPAPLKGLIEGYMSEIETAGAAAAVLGCTHFPLVEDHFRAALPVGVQMLSQPAIVADALADYLKRHPEFATRGSGKVSLLTTGDPANVNLVSGRFLGIGPSFEQL